MKAVRCLILLSVFLMTAIAYAQTGTITGKIVDEENEPVAGVTVELVGTQINTLTDDSGEYSLADVPPGNYTIRASAYAYKTQTAQVTVSAGQPVTHDFSFSLDLLAMDQVIVTGTTAPETKIESSGSISTLSGEEIRESFPRSTTEYLRRVPGFTRVESSGGEVNQNIIVRGFLGVESVTIQEDGMPVYPTMQVFFMNADNLIRLDESIETVEVLRGSDSPVFGSSASAAILNFINKTGGDKLSGTVVAYAGQGDLGRFDININGPLSPVWRFNVGGFYRYDHGIRDPGFPGTQGGQVKANATRLMSNGYFRVSAKYIDDSNQFILPLPFEDPSDPHPVSGFSDTGAFTTPEGVNASVPLPTGDILNLPLDDGIRTKGTWLTGEYNFNFGDNWNFVDTAQFMSADHQWNAIAPGTPLDANEYAQGVLKDFIGKGLAPPGSTYQLLFTNVLDAKGNKEPFDTPNNLLSPSTQFHVLKPISAFQDKLGFRKTWDRNSLAFGSYFAYYTQDNKWFFPNILMDVRDNPHWVDMVITEPDGSKLDVTKNGFRNFLATYVNAHGQNTMFSPVVSDQFNVTDRFRIDGAVRYELQNYFQTAENTSNVDIDGNPDTIYDIETFGNNTYRRFDFTLDDFAGSVGVNYQLKPNQLALYGSFNRGFLMPALDEFMFEPSQESVDLFEPRKTNMFEGGVKYSSPDVGFTATGFYGKLYNITSRGVEFDVNGNPVFVTRHAADVTSWGFEGEVLTKPLHNFEFRASGTAVDNKLSFPGLTLAAFDFTVAYIVAGNARISFDTHYVGERVTSPIGAPQIVTLPSFAYIDLGGTYRFSTTGFTMGVGLLNLTNSQGFEEGDPRNDPNRGLAQNIFNARPLLPFRVVVNGRYDW